MKEHIRGYLLTSGYLLLPTYLLSRYTMFGFYLPQFSFTRTAIVSTFMLGLVVYAALLVARYFIFHESKTGKAIVLRASVALVAFLEFSSVNNSGITTRAEHAETSNYWGPYKIVWFKALVADLGEYYSGWGTVTEINNFYEKNPFAAKFILGTKEHALATQVSTPERIANSNAWVRQKREREAAKKQAEVEAWWAKEQAKKPQTRYDPVDALEPPVETTSPVTTPTTEPPRRQTSPVSITSAPVDANGYRLSAINKRGALLNGKFQTWGTMGDGSVLAPNADYTGVTITTPSKEVINLVMKVE